MPASALPVTKDRRVKRMVCFLFYRVTNSDALEFGHILDSSCKSESRYVALFRLLYPYPITTAIVIRVVKVCA
jgi:hypothetical protein